jgi:hypothetical protein
MEIKIAKSLDRFSPRTSAAGRMRRSALLIDVWESKDAIAGTEETLRTARLKVLVWIEKQ